jgi:hypothetical protein
MSNVYHLQCGKCGLLNEKLGRRTVGDYGPKCDGCNQPLRPPQKVRTATQTGHLELRHIPNKGLGVFATQDYKEGDLVERCPAYVVNDKKVNARALLRKLELLPYADSHAGQNFIHMLLPWNENGTTLHTCVVLGYGALYNHAPLRQRNILHEGYVDPETQRLYFDFTAKRDIPAGEELCSTYNRKKDLWFIEG